MKVMNKENFERIIDGRKVSLYSLKNSKGTSLSITNYGCRIVSLVVQNKNGEPVNVVLGFDSLEAYQEVSGIYFGATIGRYANRIANGRFSLATNDYELAKNNYPNHLHGGPGGFHSKVWKVESFTGNKIDLSYCSPDGEEGYPGNLQVKTGFELTEENEVFISYEAESDEATIINLTNHAYFNLNGRKSGTILHHVLQINADLFSAVDENLIPIGSVPVVNSPFDFRTPKQIGEHIRDDNEQLKLGNGYDHNYVLPGSAESLPLVARAEGNTSGIIMEVLTDQPGMQFYTANFLEDKNLTHAEIPDEFRSAFCLETQHFPDSPNHAEYPTTVLEPGDVFHSKTVYRFI